MKQSQAVLCRRSVLILLLLPATCLWADISLTTEGGVYGTGGLAWAYAETGPRYAFAAAYSRVDDDSDTEGAQAEANAIAVNEYTVNMPDVSGVFEPGVLAKVPITYSFVLQAKGLYNPIAQLEVGSSNGYSGPLFLNGNGFAVKETSGTSTMLVNSGSSVVFKLTAKASNVVTSPIYGKGTNSLYGWAYADPIIQIDPTWEHASKFTLQEVFNPSQQSEFGSLPAALGFSELPSDVRVGAAVVPVPGAFVLGILGLGVASNKLRRRRTP